ncbi:unnamed protein product [Adineta steineri]|uniref:Uncharacterized protein n=1 Tax=Adineta steineri TaxID=433720 RepID=A0A814BFB5_9BILA|nr:unnamed protein product [Adineta steineri]CAF1332506.1 unnamed protein product [Adineta steineri]
MVSSSFSFFFSSSSTYHRLITIICILLLNPLPFIYGVPTEKIDNNAKLRRQKRHVNFNNDDILFNKENFMPKQEIIFEGLLGCKYDSNVCNQYETCLDDALFGQCWNGERSVENSLDGLTKNKLSILENTVEFLNRYHLDWKDFMTQCILSHILFAQQNHNSLQLFYQDCLNKNEFLNNIAEKQEDVDINHRQIDDDYMVDSQELYPWPIKSKSLFFDLDRSPDTLLPMSTKEQSELTSFIEATSHQKIPIDNDDFVSIERPTKIIAKESSMKEPNKMSMQMNEGYPSLVETLQINNNKQIIPKLSQEAMMNKNLANNNMLFKGTGVHRYLTAETTSGYIVINRDFKDQIEGARLLALIAQMNYWPATIFTGLNAYKNTFTFHVLNNAYRVNASNVVNAIQYNQHIIENQLGIHIINSGIGNINQSAQLSVERQNGSRLPILILATCILAIFIICSFTLFYFIKRNSHIRDKFVEITRIKGLSTNDYQDLCRRRMQTQSKDQKSSETHQVASSNSRIKHNSERSSSQSSTSSWSEEPVTPINMDIMTGHLILSYMEDHLRDRHRLEAEWQSLCTDEANEEQASCSVALSETNYKKNRYIDRIPYDHTRVRLENNDADDDDYINASTIVDSDPKCKYIATQGPIPNTTNAFWQMVWEQGSCVIVALARPIENGITMCHHYWPVEGSARFNDYEVNLVSEHIWSDDYVVRSFYLKNLQTMETRTVTQFHYLTWDELCNPPSAKSLLDFRRKVNRCFRGQSSPIIVHCNDGIGRTGTYILLDIVLNRIYKGAREINIAATLEHIRDQRPQMVKTKDQLQFVFVAVAEEVTYLIKAIPH